MNGYDVLNNHVNNNLMTSNTTASNNRLLLSANYVPNGGSFNIGQPSQISGQPPLSKNIIGSSNGVSSSSNNAATPLSSGTYTTAMGGGTLLAPSNATNNDPAKYWKQPPQHGNSKIDDIVVIHVCDENQQLSRDFCCKRDILILHMKYFQKFLSENDGNGYEDIDISVHCDVEIFEWLMTYIHAPENPSKIDKQILVSILISSEFLQMDQLVEHCIAQMTQNLNDIIKLPIDLSCISEKLINRIAALTTPKVVP
jgi:hypothetical protein